MFVILPTQVQFSQSEIWPIVIMLTLEKSIGFLALVVVYHVCYPPYRGSISKKYNLTHSNKARRVGLVTCLLSSPPRFNSHKVQFGPL
jgi:hypothetical protein